MSTNLIPLAVRKTMSRALLTVLLLAGFSVATEASATIQESARAPEPVSRTAANLPLQTVAEPVVVVAAGTVPERRSIPQSAVDSQSSTQDSGWRTYGTLLATLVLMAAIALRRHRVGGL
jgi:hypothetical protein